MLLELVLKITAARSIIWSRQSGLHALPNVRQDGLHLNVQAYPIHLGKTIPFRRCLVTKESMVRWPALKSSSAQKLKCRPGRHECPNTWRLCSPNLSPRIAPVDPQFGAYRHRCVHPGLWIGEPHIHEVRCIVKHWASFREHLQQASKPLMRKTQEVAIICMVLNPEGTHWS